MPTLHDLMSESIDGRARALQAADASPGGSTRGLIGRRRRRNAAMAGGSSALAVGALVVAGVVQESRRDDAPASADPDAVEFITTDVDALNQLDVGFLDCGEEVPPTLTEDQGFTQSIAVDRAGNSSDALRITAAVDYNGPDRAPVFVNRGYAVLTYNNAVVGYSFSGGGGDDSFETVTRGSHWTAGRVLDQALFQDLPCLAYQGAWPSSDDVAYPAGEYQVYVVSQADTSAPLVALHELEGNGYYVAGTTRGVLNPGSIDCQSYVDDGRSWNQVVPLECAETLPPGVQLDRESGSVTLPFHSADYSDDLDVTLVSEPVGVTLDHDITFGDLGFTPPPTEPDPVQRLACGEFTGSGGYDEFETDFMDIPSFADLAAGAEVPILIDVYTSGNRSRGTLHIQDDATAALLIEGGVGTYWVATVGTPVFTPSEVAIDRSKGYPDASVRLESMTECPEPTEPPWTLLNRDPSVVQWLLAIQGDFRVDWEDGTTTTADAITLRGRAEG
ncbi:hypothetical protein [Demequina sp.]|uniref:hypothetical protein n=1 Tax=Demequina sp. TaxID=2050685 RepID=UPI0025BD9272|nr:hypothetical protein [Demequina sp.]